MTFVAMTALNPFRAPTKFLRAGTGTEGKPIVLLGATIDVKMCSKLRIMDEEAPMKVDTQPSTPEIHKQLEPAIYYSPWNSRRKRAEAEKQVAYWDAVDGLLSPPKFKDASTSTSPQVLKRPVSKLHILFIYNERITNINKRHLNSTQELRW